MASGLSQEEENYIRMCLLMTGISTRAARIVFDDEIAPSCLKSTLNNFKNYNILQKLRNEGKINQIQWNLLFRNKPDVPDSKTFDVTLMITLLRHLTDLTPPGGYDCLPSANETTPLSNLARIKYHRNFLAHLVEEKIEDTKFLTAWDIVTDAISSLGGLIMKQECDNLKVKILDQSSREIILEIKRSNGEILELRKSMESLKKANEDMSLEMKKLEMSLKDTVPWNIRADIKEILDEWKDNDKMFITTRAANHVLKRIKKNSCVTITASSGVGKTATLKHVALQMGLEGYDVLPVTDPDDIIKFNNPEQKTLFVIDDLFGHYSLNQADIKVWEPVMERIKRILSNELSKIIVACRLQVYQDDKFEPVFKSCVCNLLSKSMCLSKSEKESIADIYLNTKAVKITDYYDLYDCFPLLCKLYHENPSLNITDFFQNPFTVYKKEIDQLEKKGFFSKYCALALCVIFNNNLNEEILTEAIDDETRAILENTFEACRLDRGTARPILQDDFNSFIHTFFKKKKNIYKTIHHKIFDFLVYYFGKKIICCLIKNAHSGLIKGRFLLERPNNVDKFITIVPPKYHQMYIQRMIEDWSKGKVNDVICNINMKIPQFRQKFLCCLNELEISYQRQLAHTCDVYNNDTALLILFFKGDIPMIHWCLSHNVDVNQCKNNEITPLMIAIKGGWTEVVRKLLDMGADYNKCDESGCSPVMIACCENGHTEILRMLLDIGADYDECNNDGWSPVMMACRYGNTEIVRMLLDIGTDYSKFDSNGWSLVAMASEYKHTEMVRMLLDKGADYNKCLYKNGWSPVLLACSSGHIEMVKMLLDKGADCNKCDSDGLSPVMIACISKQKEIVRMLLDKGADCNKCDNNGWSPVMRACSEGNTELTRMLLDKGADYDKCDNNGQSPVMRACSGGHTEIVRILLDLRADYDKCDNNGWSPFMCACSEGHTEIIRMLLDIGADYNKCDNYGWSPVMRACSAGHIQIVKMLFDRGADYNKCDINGWSPVMSACSQGHTVIVWLLVDKGVDYDKCDNDGRSPVMIACTYGQIEIVNMLLNKGADFNKCDNNGWSPVMSACSNGHTEIVKMLINKGVDYNKCDNDGCSPVIIACIYGQTEILRMLLDKGADYNKCDNDGWSPVMYACSGGHIQIVKMLFDRGADCKTCNIDGKSALIIASEGGHREIVNVINEHSKKRN